MREILLSIKLATKSLRTNPARTALSLLGVAIGIAAVIAVLALGDGIKRFIIGQLESFGTNIIEVEVKVPKTAKTSSQNVTGLIGGTQVTTFKLADAEAIAHLSNLNAWYAGQMGQQIIKYGNQNKQTMIMGVTAGISAADDQFEISKGRAFEKEDGQGLKQVVVIGAEIEERFFPGKEALGKRIRIKGQSYQIIGVLKRRGSTGFFDFDNLVYIPLETLQKKLMGIDYIQFAIFKVNDKNKMKLTAREITELIRSRHHIKQAIDDDFSVNSTAEAAVILNQVFAVINILLVAFASISLVVGGVGVTNVMYVSVTERTSEIGLRKSLGAKNADILRQFLFEAIFLTFLGGLAGILIGFLAAQMGEWIVTNYGYQVVFAVSWKAIVLGLSFSFLTGVVFGVRPAKKASQLSPMEALRWE